MKPLMWKILNTAAAVIASQLAARALSKAWRVASGGDPPTVPEDPESSLREAVIWASVSGAVMGLAKMIATRRAAQYYLQSTGELPKSLRHE